MKKEKLEEMRMGTVLCKNRRREAEISNDIS
jgi:hypothetical protein